MSPTTMSEPEREAFLADVHVGVLSVERADGPPLTSPVWYRYRDGVVEITTTTDARKAEALRAAGRASFCVQREEVPPAYVTVEGPVELGTATREQRVDIAARYLGPEGGEAYVAGTQGPDDDVAVLLTPAVWRTVDFAKVMG